mgnify:CR=1 FL=1
MVGAGRLSPLAAALGTLAMPVVLVSATTLMTGPVQGLRYENGIAVVQVHGEEFYVSDIYQVS